MLLIFFLFWSGRVSQCSALSIEITDLLIAGDEASVLDKCGHVTGQLMDQLSSQGIIRTLINDRGVPAHVRV
jgi:hypothetical protein